MQAIHVRLSFNFHSFFRKKPPNPYNSQIVHIRQSAAQKIVRIYLFSLVFAKRPDRISQITQAFHFSPTQVDGLNGGGSLPMYRGDLR
jgi:hypothetical protein